MSQRPWKIVIAEPFDATAVAKMEAIGEVIILDECNPAALAHAVVECDALLIRSNAAVTAELLSMARNLRVIGRGGVGLENIDIDAAAERGIAVVYTPGAATDAVAELTIGLMIALLRNIASGDAAIRAGGFEKARAESTGPQLGQLTLGIIGLGRIGKAVANRCHHGFGMRIVYNDIIDPGPLPFPATRREKPELYRAVDIVSLHVPLTDETRSLIDEHALSQFKPGAYLINTARGAIVDSDALSGALRSGRLTGAALDVFDPEPLPPDHPIISAPGTLFTPHIGARTPEGLARMNDVVDDVIRVLAGEPPLYPAKSE